MGKLVMDGYTKNPSLSEIN